MRSGQKGPGGSSRSPRALKRSETAPQPEFEVRREKSVEPHLPSSRRASGRGRHKRRLSDPVVQEEAGDASCTVTVLVQQRFRMPLSTPLEDVLPKILASLNLEPSDGDRLSMFVEEDGEEPLNAAIAAATAAGQKAHFKRLQLSKSLADQCDDSMLHLQSGITCLLSAKPHKSSIAITKCPTEQTRVNKRMKSDFVSRPSAAQRRSLHLEESRGVRRGEDLKRSAPKKSKKNRNPAGGRGGGGDQLKEMRNFTFGHGLHPALSPSLSLPLSDKGVEAPSKLSLDGMEPLDVVSSDPVFGTALETIMERTQETHDIPNVIVALKNHLVEHCLHTEGIFRTSGSSERVAALTRLVNHSELPTDLDLSVFHPHVVAEVFKNFLRGMPRPVVPSIMYERALATTHLVDKDLQLMYSKALMAAIPTQRHSLLVALLRFLKKVEQHQEENKMSRKNLSIVFGPLILRQLRNDDLSEMLSNLERVSEVVNHLIENVDNFGPDDSPLITGFVDADQEAHAIRSSLKLQPGDVIHVYGRVKKKWAIEREGEFGTMSAKVRFTPVSLYNLTPPQRKCGHSPSKSVPSDLVKGLLSPRRSSRDGHLPEKTKGKKDKKKRRDTGDDGRVSPGLYGKGSDELDVRPVSPQPQE